MGPIAALGGIEPTRINLDLRSKSRLQQLAASPLPHAAAQLSRKCSLQQLMAAALPLAASIRVALDDVRPHNGPMVGALSPLPLRLCTNTVDLQ